MASNFWTLDISVRKLLSKMFIAEAGRWLIS